MNMTDAPVIRLSNERITKYYRKALELCGEKYRELLDVSPETKERGGVAVTFTSPVTAITAEPLPLTALYGFDVVVEFADDETGEIEIPIYRNVVDAEGKTKTFAMFPSFNCRITREEAIEEFGDGEATMHEVFAERLGYNARIRGNEATINRWLAKQVEEVN